MSSSKLDDLYASLPLPGKVGMFMWTYLAANGWYSTYMLITKIDEAWRNEMFGTLIPESAFVWVVTVMFLTSSAITGLLFYGRYTSKKKKVIKVAVAKAEETGEWKDPQMKFDLAVVPFWIGATVLTVLMSIVVMVVALSAWSVGFEAEVLYLITGVGVSMGMGILMYLMAEWIANGVLDGKAIKDLIASVAGSPEAQKVIGTFCKRVGIADQETVDKIFEKVRGFIKAKSFSELTPEEMLVLQNAVREIREGT